MHNILTYNDLNHSLPACIPPCVPVSINLKYYYHSGAGKKIGQVIWTGVISRAHSPLHTLLSTDRQICYVRLIEGVECGVGIRSGVSRGITAHGTN